MQKKQKKPANFEDVVLIISKALEGKQYAIRGTASLVLQGMEMNVDDIDILCDKKTALEINKILKEYIVEKVEYKESPKFKSFFGKFNIEGIDVEVMGEWEVLDTRGDWAGPYNADKRTKVELRGESVYVTTIERELEVFVKMGRWNAYHKIKKQIGNTGNMKKLLIIDTYNFLHRAYHALPITFRGPDGQPTNAVYGFTSMILNVLERVKPDYIVAALDGPEPTFRVSEFTPYKAQRKPIEEDLDVQIPKAFEILDAFQIKKILVEGYEADDVIGTVATRFEGKVDIVIISNDKDLWQLAGNGNIIMVPGRKGEFEWMGEKEVDAKLGFEADKVADYKGLRGDPSDNIPGVYGIGEVTATKLLQKYGSLEEIYKDIDNIQPESLRKKLLESYEQALISKKLAQIVLDVPFQLDLEECRYSEINKVKVKEVLERYNFKSLIRRLGFADSGETGKKVETPDNQLSLL